MSPVKPRRVPRSALVVALVGGVLALQIGQAGPQDTPRVADAAVVAANGDLDLQSSLDGSPILTASNLAPGDSASGQVTVANAGAGSGAFTLNRHTLTDTPGAGGGALSARLQLEVIDVTSPASPVAVYSGPLGSMPQRGLGTLLPGQQRTYRFEANLPEGGTADDAYAGAAASVTYRWTVSSDSGPVDPPVDPPGPPGGGGPGGNGGPRPTVPGGTVPGPGFVQPGLRLGVGMRKKQRLRGRTVRVQVLCSQSCRFISRAGIRVKGAKNALGRSRWLRMRGQPGRSVTVKLRVSKRTLVRARAAMAKRKRVVVRVKLRARNTATGTRVVTLKTGRVVSGKRRAVR